LAGQETGHEKVIGRVLAFSDGVFAIAILLLLIDIRLPADTTDAGLGQALLGLWPNYLAFIISFFVIGLYWTAHVRLFREIVRYNWTMVWLNMLYLFFIVTIPFATVVLSTHFTQLSVAVYAGVVMCAGYMNTILRAYAMLNHRLIIREHSHAYIRKNVLLSLFAPVGFTVAIGVSFLNAMAAEFLWIAIAIVHIVFQRWVKEN
jgi:uncharacterized membrane protein